MTSIDVHALHIRRVYLPAADGDGWRVLVDRLWPRGLRKQDAQLDAWLKDVAPSPALRKWFGHEPERFDDFRARYLAELAANPGPVAEIEAELRRGPVTLLFGARDLEHNHARVLQDYLLRRDQV